MQFTTIHSTASTCQWDQCGHWCPDASTLYDHVISTHIGTAREGQNVCLQCKWQECTEAANGKVFRRRYSITSHILVHVPLYQFYCNVCGRGFKRKPDLNKHVTVCKKVTMNDQNHEVMTWTKKMVAAWLPTAGLGDYEALFLENDIDGPLLFKLSHSFLKSELEIKSAGKREAILMAIEELRCTGSKSGASSSNASTPNFGSNASPISSTAPTMHSPQGSDSMAMSGFSLDTTMSHATVPACSDGQNEGDIDGLQELIDFQLNQRELDSRFLESLEVPPDFVDFDATLPDLNTQFLLDPLGAQSYATTPSSDIVSNTSESLAGSEGSSGQVKRGAEEDGGGGRKRQEMVADFFSKMAGVLAENGRNFHEKDLDEVLHGYSPEKMQELALSLGQVTQALSSQIAKQASSRAMFGTFLPPSSSTVSLPTLAQPPSFAVQTAMPASVPLPVDKVSSAKTAAQHTAKPSEVPVVYKPAAPLFQWARESYSSPWQLGRLEAATNTPVSASSLPQDPSELLFGASTKSKNPKPIGNSMAIGFSFLQPPGVGKEQRTSRRLVKSEVVSTPAEQPVIKSEPSTHSSAPLSLSGVLSRHWKRLARPTHVSTGPAIRYAFSPTTAVPAFTTPVRRLYQQRHVPQSCEIGETEPDQSTDEISVRVITALVEQALQEIPTGALGKAEAKQCASHCATVLAALSMSPDVSVSLPEKDMAAAGDVHEPTGALNILQSTAQKQALWTTVTATANRLAMIVSSSASVSDITESFTNLTISPRKSSRSSRESSSAVLARLCVQYTSLKRLQNMVDGKASRLECIGSGLPYKAELTT